MPAGERTAKGARRPPGREPAGHRRNRSKGGRRWLGSPRTRTLPSASTARAGSGRSRASAAASPSTSPSTRDACASSRSCCCSCPARQGSSPASVPGSACRRSPRVRRRMPQPNHPSRGRECALRSRPRLPQASVERHRSQPKLADMPQREHPRTRPHRRGGERIVTDDPPGRPPRAARPPSSLPSAPSSIACTSGGLAARAVPHPDDRHRRSGSTFRATSTPHLTPPTARWIQAQPSIASDSVVTGDNHQRPTPGVGPTAGLALRLALGVCTTSLAWPYVEEPHPSVAHAHSSTLRRRASLVSVGICECTHTSSGELSARGFEDVY